MSFEEFYYVVKEIDQESESALRNRIRFIPDEWHRRGNGIPPSVWRVGLPTPTPAAPSSPSSLEFALAFWPSYRRSMRSGEIGRLLTTNSNHRRSCLPKQLCRMFCICRPFPAPTAGLICCRLFYQPAHRHRHLVGSTTPGSGWRDHVCPTLRNDTSKAPQLLRWDQSIQGLVVPHRCSMNTVFKPLSISKAFVILRGYFAIYQ